MRHMWYYITHIGEYRENEDCWSFECFAEAEHTPLRIDRSQCAKWCVDSIQDHLVPEIMRTSTSPTL